MWSLRAGPPYSSIPWTNHPLAPGPGVHPKKVYPWEAAPRVSSRVHSPHVMSLHQSAPPVESLNHVARIVFAHSSLFSHAVSRWWVRSSRLCYFPCRSRSSSICWRSYITCRWDTSVSTPCSEDAPTKNYVLGPKRCHGITLSPGNWITRSIAAAWLVSLMAFIFLGVGPFSLYLFFIIFIDVFKGFDFLRTVLWPVHLCLCPRRARLNWAARFWVPTCSCWFSFFC